MDWLGAHIEFVIGTLGSLTVSAVTFIVGYARMGDSVRAAQKETQSVKQYAATEFTRFESELKSLRERQDVIERGYMDELRKIGERLARMEGYLTQANIRPKRGSNFEEE